MKAEPLLVMASIAFYFFFIFAIIHLLARIAKAQNEATRHLSEIAKDTRAIAMMKSKKNE